MKRITLYFKKSPSFTTEINENQLESIIKSMENRPSSWNMFKGDNGDILTAFKSSDVVRLHVYQDDEEATE